MNTKCKKGQVKTNTILCPCGNVTIHPGSFIGEDCLKISSAQTTIGATCFYARLPEGVYDVTGLTGAQPHTILTIKHPEYYWMWEHGKALVMYLGTVDEFEMQKAID